MHCKRILGKTGLWQWQGLWVVILDLRGFWKHVPHMTMLLSSTSFQVSAETGWKEKTLPSEGTPFFQVTTSLAEPARDTWSCKRKAWKQLLLTAGGFFILKDKGSSYLVLFLKTLANSLLEKASSGYGRQEEYNSTLYLQSPRLWFLSLLREITEYTYFKAFLT